MKKVTIYSTPTCPYCTMAKEYLKENKIEYTEYDVAADKDKAQEMIDKSGQMGVPVIIIKDGDKEEVLVGFDQAKVAKVLDLEK
jgi:glutaredoxin-like YruB-family protein